MVGGGQDLVLAEKKPENGGTPAMASQPTMKVAAVIGMTFSAARPCAACPARRRHPVDHRAGAQEEQRLEKGVGDQVKDTRRL
jgi:hypothetical protein